MPKVSIVITCYNLGAYLEEALGSALSQTFSNHEVLLVDDGSTDPATVALLDRLPNHPRLRVLRTENQGVARARNYGIGQAEGDYILPLDADDRIGAEYLARAVPVLDASEEVGFVGCHYRIFGERQGECRPEHYRLPDLLVENVVPIASLFRRTCWELVGGYCPDLNSVEDWDLWIGILERGYRGVVLPQIHFEYRVRPNSNLSDIHQPELYQQRMQLLYRRHRSVYDRYRDEVLSLKDVQFARQNAYTHWLEQQRRSWEHVAEERLALLERYSRRAGRLERRRAWLEKQAARLRRIALENPTMLGRARALLLGTQRVARRRIQARAAELAGRFTHTPRNESDERR